MGLLDHLSFVVADFPRSRAFYHAALAPLGWGVHSEEEGSILFGPGGRPCLGIAEGQEPGETSGPLHFAIEAEDRAAVRAFHAAALGAGGRDNGAPGIRAQYHQNYYAAFVFDPDGNNIEAVCHAPGSAKDQ